MIVGMGEVHLGVQRGDEGFQRGYSTEAVRACADGPLPASIAVAQVFVHVALEPHLVTRHGAPAIVQRLGFTRHPLRALDVAHEGGVRRARREGAGRVPGSGNCVRGEKMRNNRSVLKDGAVHQLELEGLGHSGEKGIHAVGT